MSQTIQSGKKKRNQRMRTKKEDAKPSVADNMTAYTRNAEESMAHF